MLGLPRRGRRVPAPGRLRRGIADGASALRRSARHRRDPADAPALRPHARRVQLHRGAPVRAGRALPADPGLCPGRRPGPHRDGIQRRGRVRSRTSTRSTVSSPAASRSARSRSRRPGQPPGRDVRRAHRAPGGRVLAYSSDTAPCDALLRLAHGADVFLCEASYLDGTDNPPDLHLTGRRGGRGRDQGRRRQAAADPPRGGVGQRGADATRPRPPRSPGRWRSSAPAPDTTSEPSGTVRRHVNRS